MCGIAGYIGPRHIDQVKIDKTLESLGQRGPDNRDVARFDLGDNQCFLLHTRLNIIDFDARANQPFAYKDKIISYNGEIYNYLEVKEKLQKLGHSFLTTSDTEVLIHAVEEWGSSGLNIVEGMWAFAYFDKETKTLTLSRDPFGEKPLYIYQPSKDELYFASEMNALMHLSGVQFAPNKNHISRFLVNGYKSLFKQSELFFDNVRALPKASVLEFQVGGSQREYRYWHPQINVNDDMSFEDARQKTRELLIDSVQKRLRSDTPIAFCMSGGIDSNSLISIARRELDYDVHGFTIVNQDSRYEEQDMIDIGVRELDIKHDSYPVSTDNFIENLTSIIRYHGAPVITISMYLNWILQKSIADHGYHISISGTAADELFSGYFDHQLLYFYDVRHDEKLFRESVENWQRDIGPIVRNPILKNPYAMIENPFERGHAYLNCEKYSGYLQHPWQEPFEEKYFREGLLQNRMMNELFHETTPVSLHNDDLNAMYFSIENRSPFLDRNLFEFANSIPTKHLVKDGKAKMVLREAMRGIVPDPILDSKRKVGFNAPIFDLLDVKNEKVRNYLLQDSPIWDVVQKEPIEELISNADLPNSDSKFLFAFLSSKIFMEEFSA